MKECKECDCFECEKAEELLEQLTLKNKEKRTRIRDLEQQVEVWKKRATECEQWKEKTPN